MCNYIHIYMYVYIPISTIVNHQPWYTIDSANWTCNLRSYIRQLFNRHLSSANPTLWPTVLVAQPFSLMPQATANHFTNLNLNWPLTWNLAPWKSHESPSHSRWWMGIAPSSISMCLDASNIRQQKKKCLGIFLVKNHGDCHRDSSGFFTVSH